MHPESSLNFTLGVVPEEKDYGCEVCVCVCVCVGMGGGGGGVIGS